MSFVSAATAAQKAAANGADAFKAAFGDGAEIGADIFLGILRFAIVMIPVTLFILAPAWFVFKWLRRRIPWPAKAAAASATDPGE